MKKIIRNGNVGKYGGRSKTTNGIFINCPRHGNQNTYDLYNHNGNIKGVGCWRCFKNVKKI